MTVPEENINRCKLLFTLMDLDKDSCIETSKVESMCRALGAVVASDDLKEFLSENTEGKVNYDQFFKFYSSQYARGMNKKKLLAAFEFVDKSKSGTISYQELKHACMVLGEVLTEEEADDVLKKYNQGGKINYKKMIDDMCKTN